MTRIGVNILLVGFLILGLGSAAYLLPFLMPFDTGGIQIFEIAVLVCWGTGAVLIVARGVMAVFGKATSRSEY
jgi:hypothetical protein